MLGQLRAPQDVGPGGAQLVGIDIGKARHQRLFDHDLRAQEVAPDHRQRIEPRFPDVDLSDLREAWADILKRAKLHQHHRISREQLSVREYMTKMLRRLQGVRFVEFQELFDTATSPTVLVVTFIAMLELSRERLLEVTQAEAFAPIYVRLAYQPS